MLASISKKMMQRSFEKAMYRFRKIPESHFRGTFGIYIHVPFCYSRCTFCPFYKELYSEEQKAAYLDAILREIDATDLQGRARWLYIGGGTPNTLRLDELEQILSHLRRKVQLDSVGIELLPARLTEDYLVGLKALGFTKISVGVESLAQQVIGRTGRKIAGQGDIGQIIAFANTLGLWTNVDLMVGLPRQDAGIFLADVRAVITMLPSQVTIYPFMVIRGLKAQPSMPEAEQFTLIDEAGELLAPHGYRRPSIWAFTRGDDMYDSSRDELVEDYVGFGPAAFSTYDAWKVVNLDLQGYLKGVQTGQCMGFVAPRSKASASWRRFASMLYDLNCEPCAGAPAYINLFVWLLKLAGYGEKGKVTAKGRRFAHELTKTVVEALPFPVQNPACVENYVEYQAYSDEP